MKKKEITFISILIFIDQITKYLIDTNLILNKQYPIIKGFLNITSTHNYGAAFSILTGQTPILIIITIITIYYLSKLLKNNTKVYKYILYAGIIGNLIDRIFLGYVRDFLDFKIINYNYPIFNISDIFICIGVILIIIEEVKEDKNGSKNRRYRKKNR